MSQGQLDHRIGQAESAVGLACRLVFEACRYPPLLVAVAAFALLLGWPALAAAADAAPAVPTSGSLLIGSRSGYRTALVLETRVSIRASGLVARTTLTQTFRNDGSEWAEGVYVFPLPATAAVDALRMRVGERRVEGEIRAAAEAEKMYQTARREGRRASLVRQQRANLFTADVANIAPGATVAVEIEYLEVLSYSDGAFSLRLPLTFTPRYIPGRPVASQAGSGWSTDTDRVPDASAITPPVVASSRGHRVSIRAVIDAGVPLAVVASRYHPVTVDRDDGLTVVAMDDPDALLDHDFELVWRPVPHTAPRALVFRETVEGRPHYLFMVLPPDASAAPPRPVPRDVVFVIDTSGSMHGTSIEQAKAALGRAIAALSPGDTFNLIRFASHTEAFAARSLPATPANLAAAARYVETLSAEGGTEMRPALELALGGAAGDGRLRQVVFVTDGSVGNEQELYGIIERLIGENRLFTVGIGSAPNGWFMQKAAEIGRGSRVTISALDEVEEKMDRLLARLGQPQVTGVQLTWPDGVVAEAYPATVPDLYGGEPVLVRVRLDGEPRAGDQLVVDGTTPAGPWRAELPLAPGGESAGTAALWARARIGDLGERARRGMDPDTMRDAIVGTALAYGLVSRHTSLVAVDRAPARPDDAALARAAVPSLLPRGQDLRAIFGFPATATDAGRRRAAGSVAILLGTLLLLLRVWNGTGPGHDRASRR